jgi:hypothetical protein
MQLEQTPFDSAEEFEKTLLNYKQICNEHIPQRALHYLTPMQAVQKWLKDKPELFVKLKCNPPKLDS